MYIDIYLTKSNKRFYSTILFPTFFRSPNCLLFETVRWRSSVGQKVERKFLMSTKNNHAHPSRLHQAGSHDFGGYQTIQPSFCQSSHHPNASSKTGNHLFDVTSNLFHLTFLDLRWLPCIPPLLFWHLCSTAKLQIFMVSWYAAAETNWWSARAGVSSVSNTSSSATSAATATALHLGCSFDCANDGN